MKQIQQKFPKGVKLGIKNPYFKIGLNSGDLNLRNDNPQNIVLEESQEEDPLVFKEEGNTQFK